MEESDNCRYQAIVSKFELLSVWFTLEALSVIEGCAQSGSDYPINAPVEGY